MKFLDIAQKSKFFKSSMFANSIILFGMVPQFFIVPLIISYWGEAEYTKYVTFLAIVNIFSQINAAMQNGYILRLIPNIKFSVNELFSMSILTVIMGIIAVIGLLMWSKYFALKYESLFFTCVIFVVVLVFLLNSFKLILQIGVSVLAPLLISSLLSCITIISVVCIIYLQLENKIELIKIIVFSYAIIVFLSGISSIFFIVNRGLAGTISFENILHNAGFLIRFGGLSLAVSSISNLFQNGTKIYLGTNYEANFLVDFNLSFTLCMISIQFISPIIGLVFPYLTKEKFTKDKNLIWICNLHKIFWMFAIIMYISYSLLISRVILLWLGSNYLYLNNSVCIFLYYFIFTQAASIGVQYLKSVNRQILTLFASIFSYFLVPSLIFVNLEKFDVYHFIYIFCITGGVFYFIISFILISITNQNLRMIKYYIPDAIFGCGSIFLLTLFSSISNDDFHTKIISSFFILMLMILRYRKNPITKMV